MGDASQHFLNYIEAAVHNCPAVRNVSSVIAYKDTKNKQNKTEERADKLGFVQTFVSRFQKLLSVSSLLFLCFTVVRECHCTKKAAMLQLQSLLFDMSLTCEGKSLPTF